MTAWLAPPCSGPHSAQTPPAAQAKMLAWLDAIMRIVQQVMDYGATARVVSLGVDAAADDPESPLEITQSGYFRAGELLGALGLPTIALQEGGYHLPTLGSLVRATLEGLDYDGGGSGA